MSMEFNKSTAQRLHDEAASKHPILCDPDNPSEYPPSSPNYQYQVQHDLAVYHGGAGCPGMGGDVFNHDPDMDDGWDELDGVKHKQAGFRLGKNR